MRTLIKNKLIREFFLIFLVMMLTACTGREDVVLELDGSRIENMPETDAGSVSGTDVGIAGASETETGTGPAPSGGSTGVPDMETEAENSAMEQEAAILSDIYVHICGAVETPGVYILTEGSRVYEGIAAAGGFREDACEEFINQAGILRDGQRLVIPTVEEVEEAEADGSYQTLWKEAEEARWADSSGNTDAAGDALDSKSGLVNINTASEGELSAISGIGAGKAAAIVQYRQENGNFTSIEDIMKVSGIKEGTFEKIKDRITVD